jgi:ADP-ribosylglycohydrolase
MTDGTGVTPDKSRFSGCLIGQCLGDAFGAPVEGMPRVACRHYIDTYMQAWHREDEDVVPIYIGQYTDDSQLARELMQSYAECGDFDPEDYARRIADIFRENRIVGRGIATDQAAMRLIEGMPWKKSGCPSPSAGNGSAMRAAPVGLLYYDDPERLISAARDQSWITHQDSRCLAGAVAIAGATALTVVSELIDPHAFVSQLAEWTAPINAEFAEILQRLPEWITLPADDAVNLIKIEGKPAEYADGWPGISPFVVSSVLWSLYSFLRFRDDYWDTIRTAIAVGGDVDTTAAMAGAISGAYLGLDAIPDHLARYVHDNHTWGYAELIALAERCHTVKHGDAAP